MGDELSPALARYSAQATKGSSSSYAKADYWDDRFTGQDTEGFDWYVGYGELEDWFDEHLPPSAKADVLMVGCGNSDLSRDMHKGGFRKIVNIDISEAVIGKMRHELSALGMEWNVMDATAMEYKDASFDLAVDKGTLDALMNGTDETHVLAMVAEVWRTLRPGGLFFVVSHSRLRGNVLDEAVHRHHGENAAWEQVEARWNQLSNQATLINLIRAKLGPGQTIRSAFRDFPLLKEAGDETRRVIKILTLMSLFRQRRLNKEKMDKAKDMVVAKKEGREISWQRPSEVPPEEPSRHWDEVGKEEGGEINIRKQPYCYVYVLRKKVL